MSNGVFCQHLWHKRIQLLAGKYDHDFPTLVFAFLVTNMKDITVREFGLDFWFTVSMGVLGALVGAAGIWMFQKPVLGGKLPRILGSIKLRS
jgi:hypothetical protein